MSKSMMELFDGTSFSRFFAQKVITDVWYDRKNASDICVFKCYLYKSCEWLMFFTVSETFLQNNETEAYSESCQTSKMERFAKTDIW